MSWFRGSWNSTPIVIINNTCATPFFHMVYVLPWVGSVCVCVPNRCCNFYLTCFNWMSGLIMFWVFFFFFAGKTQSVIRRLAVQKKEKKVIVIKLVLKTEIYSFKTYSLWLEFESPLPQEKSRINTVVVTAWVKCIQFLTLPPIIKLNLKTLHLCWEN